MLAAEQSDEAVLQNGTQGSPFLASALAKLPSDVLLRDLPAERTDPLWTVIGSDYSLTVFELTALKNARCPAGKVMHVNIYMSCVS